MALIRKTFTILIIITCSLIGCILMREKVVKASEQANHIESGGTEYVHIAPNAISVPLRKILIIRRDSRYCAVKFTEYWKGKTQDEEYARYVSYYQNDNTGNFSKENVHFTEGKLSFPRSYGIGRFSFTFGRDTDVRCGSIRLGWTGKSWLYFYESNQTQGDYGVEIAPTIWNDISQVNVFDPRIQWYKYDSKRENVTIPIDRLWEGKEKEK